MVPDLQHGSKVLAMASKIRRQFSSIPWLGTAARILRWSLRILPVLILMDLGYLLGIWPD